MRWWLAILLLLAGPGWSQRQSVVLREGEWLDGATQVERPYQLCVTDGGRWFAGAGVLVKGLRRIVFLDEGAVVLREGDPLPLDGNEVIGTLSSRSHVANNGGRSTRIIRLDGTAGGNQDDGTLFLDDVLLAREGNLLRAPQVSAGTIYKACDAARVNDLDQVLARVRLDDPYIQGNNECAVARFALDDRAHIGTVTTDVLLKEGDPVPGVGVPVRAVSGYWPTLLGLNNRGDVLFPVRAQAHSSVDTGLLLNDRLVAREGRPSPDPARLYGELFNAEVDLNDFGEYVFRGALGTEYPPEVFIQRNDEFFVRQGESFPAIAPLRIRDFRSTPVQISNSGDVYWFAQFGEVFREDQAAFRNFDVILREGDEVGGRVVQQLRPGFSAFDVSDSGRFWVGNVILEGVGTAVVLVDFGAVVPVLGCDTNEGELTLDSGTANTGNTLTFAMDDAQALGATPLLFFSTGLAPLTPCGPVGPFGELLIDLGAGNPVGRKVGTPFDGTPALLPLTLPADPSLVDVVTYAQGVFVDVAGSVPLRATNALCIEIGSP